MGEKRVRVLIVEDTPVAMKLLKSMVINDERFELIGAVEDGKQAVDFAKNFQPDVISMDLFMPVLDGIEATQKIMQECPVPIVIVSSLYQSSEVEMAIKVLEAGAVCILPRPFGPGHAKYLQSTKKYLDTLKLMSDVKVVKRRNGHSAVPLPPPESKVSGSQRKFSKIDFRVLAIGASAGGPQGLLVILSGLPANFPLPVFVVQHIDSHFAEGFSDWLNSESRLPVHIAVDGEKIVPGHVYLPPGDHHLVVNPNGTVSTLREINSKSLRPSVNVLFKSIAEVYGGKSIAVILSGMGKDGATELKKLYDLGAYTLAQDELSCLVFGMPGEAILKGAVHKVLSPAQIIEEINSIMKI